MTNWTICPIVCSEVIDMSDYKELYLTMFQACEEAIRALTAAQEACEARYGDLMED